MQGWHDKQVGVGTQPCPLPLLPKGPDTTQGLYTCGCSPWMDKDYPTCRAKQHTTYPARNHPHLPPTPSRVHTADWAGASVSPLIPRLRSLPPPALSSDYPGKRGPRMVPQPLTKSAWGRWPLVPTAFQFRFSKLPSFPHLSVTRLAQCPPSLCSLHAESPAPQAFKSAWPLPMLSQVPSPLRAVGGADARLGTLRTGGVGR